MGIVYAGEPCIDPRELHESCLEQDPPLPTAPWWGIANSYRCSVGNFGLTPGSGLVLLTKASLNRINLAAAHDLVWTDDRGRVVTFKSCIVRRYQDCSPGLAGALIEPYCVWLTDPRWVYRRVPIDKAYNVRAANGGAYMTNTLNAGINWTWQTMFADIWQTASGLGAAPTLPFTPDGTPEGFAFYGSTVWKALACVFQRITCAMRFDPTTANFGVVRLGVTDAIATNAIVKLGQPIWDEYAARPAYARLPEKVRVLFLKEPPPTDGTSLYYTVSTADTAPLAGTLAGTVVDLIDGLQALYPSGTLTNAAALASRATERAADWFRKQKNFNRPFHRTYEGFRPESLTVMGPTALAVVVEDRGVGMRTEIVAGPDDVVTGGGIGGTVDLLDTTRDPATWISECGECCGGGGGASGVASTYAQANDLPTLPGIGPHKTFDFNPAAPTLGANLATSLTDDPASNRVKIILDNLGIFGRVQKAGTTYGARRRISVSKPSPGPLNGSNLSTSITDDAGNDEFDITIDNLGFHARAKSGVTIGPRRQLNIDRAVPTIGANIDVTLADGGANDEVKFTFDNLGVFGRCPQIGAAFGPRRRISLEHVPVTMGTNMAVGLTDGVVADDELKFTVKALGMFARRMTDLQVGPRPRIKFIPGGGIGVAVADDAPNEEIAVTLTAPNAVNPAPLDWHYFRHISTNYRFYNPWPTEYPQLTGGDYTGTDLAGVQVIDGLIVAVPYLETRGGTLDRIGLYIGIAGATLSKVRLGIYNSASVTNLVPNALIIDAGLLAVDAGGFVELSISQLLSPGVVYWLAIRYDANVTLPNIAGRAAGQDQLWAPFGVLCTGSAAINATASWPRASYKTTQGALAALPNPFPANPLTISKDAATPLVYVRYSS